MPFFKEIVHFLRSHPAFFYSLAILYGFWGALRFEAPFLISLSLFLCPLFLNRKGPKHFIYAWISILAFVFLVSKFLIVLPDFKGDDKIFGSALFEISEVKTSSGKKVYFGNLKKFIDQEGTLVAKNIPGSFFSFEKTKNLTPGCLIEFTGFLKKHPKVKHRIQLENLKGIELRVIKENFSLVPFREELKKSLASWIKNKLPSIKAASFVTGMAIGEFKEEELTFSFGRFGLQHILAISGFHFSLISLFLLALLKTASPYRYRLPSLAFLLTFYFCFLGMSPSIVRAFCMVLLSIFASIFGRQSNSINALGLALSVCLILDPFSLFSLGFIFSFAITFSLLIFTPFFEGLLIKIFNERKKTDFLASSFKEKVGLSLIGFMRKSLSLSLGVNVVALPLTLALIGSFPLFGILFNLYFPVLISVSLIFFLLLSLLSLLTPFSWNFLFYLNSLFIDWLLSLSLSMPKAFDFVLKMPLNGEIAVFLLTLIFLIGIPNFNSRKNKMHESLIF